MNKQLEEYARTTLKDGLAKLPESWQTKFKQMYANGNLSMSITDVVDKMDAGKLDWAMSQVENSLKKL